MNRHIAVMLLVGLVTALDPSATVQAADCVPWAETTDLPDVYPEVQLDRMAVAGSLLVGTKDQVFYVYRLDGQDDPELISSVSMGQYINRIRVLEGHVYLMPWSGISWHVELADPDHPQLVPVAVPAGNLRDVVRFDGGYLMLSSADSVYVVDDPAASDPDIIAAFELEDPHRAVATGSMAYVAADDGVVPVDLSDPAHPVVGDDFHFHPSGNLYWGFGARNMLIHDNVLYGQFAYASIDYHEEFLMAVDIGDPFAPEPMVRHLVNGVAGALEIVDDRLVMLDGWSLVIREPVDLEPVVRIHAGGNPLAGIVAGDHYLVAFSYDGLKRIDLRDPYTVEPVLTLPDGYDPSGCGPYGLATTYSYAFDYSYGGYRLTGADWTIYDQMSVAPLDSLAAGSIGVSSYGYGSCQCTVNLAAMSDRWVVVWVWRSCFDGDYPGYSNTSLIIHDLVNDSQSTLPTNRYGSTVLDGDFLWTIRRGSMSASHLQTYALGNSEAVLLYEIAIPNSSFSFPSLYVSDEIYLVNETTVTVYSTATTDDLTPVRELQVDQDIELHDPGFVEDGLLYTCTTGGFAVVDLDPASPLDPVVIGACDLDLGGLPYRLERQDDRVIIHRSGGWQAIDISDPTLPTVISPMFEFRTEGLHWSGHLLYVNTGDAVHLFDVSDIANPQWVGQSTPQSTRNTSPCGLEELVISAEHALPPDCSDIAATEPDDQADPREIPSAVALHPVTPNPFNPSTTITFELRHTERVELVVHDLRGRRLATLLDRECPPGRHNVQWQGRDDHGRALPSGTYLVQMRTESAVRAQKLMLVR